MPRVAVTVILSLAASAAAERLPVPAPEPPPPPPPVPEVKVTRATTKSQTSLTSKVVIRRISSSYAGGLKRCYERVLRTTPDAQGAATVTFTVDAVGKVTAPRVRSFHGGLSKCVSGLVARWRFPIPQSRYAEPTTAQFAVGLGFALVTPPEEAPAP